MLIADIRAYGFGLLAAALDFASINTTCNRENGYVRGE
jgi:hypothetical protein